jgi:hypothetical protein
MNSVLTDEAIEKIRAEERLRKEISECFSTPKSDGKKYESLLWTFLNSSFGIWFLSTVFVTAIGTIYTKQQDKRNELSKKAELQWVQDQQKLDSFRRAAVELAQRYSNTLTNLKYLSDRSKASNQLATPENIKAALLPLTSTPDSQKEPSIYAEYRTFTALGLMAELHRLELDHGRALQIKEHLTRTNMALNQIANLNQLADPKALASNLVQAVRSPYWDSGFAYTDCPPKNPFDC